MVWFWYFIAYSFLGFLLEVVYAKATGGRRERKCLLLLPLCPVYGLGVCLILLLSGPVKAFPPMLFLTGAAGATAVEYLTSLFYEKLLGVSFWDYQELHGNLHGRVCLPFSVAWGILTLPTVYWLHPAVAPLAAAIPLPVGSAAFVTLLTDCTLSALLLRKHRDISCLSWWGGLLKSDSSLRQ